MCHCFVRIKLVSAIISRRCDSHEKHPYSHLPAHAPTHTIHTHTYTRTRTYTYIFVCSPSELLTFSSRLIAIDICLLSWACSRVGADGNGWCYCWRRKKRGKEKEMVVVDGGGVEKRRTRVDKLPTLPQESIWTPCSPERSQGRLSLTSSLQKSHRCDWRLWGCNMALLLRHTTCHLPSLSTVIMEETYSNEVTDRSPETFVDRCMD